MNYEIIRKKGTRELWVANDFGLIAGPFFSEGEANSEIEQLEMADEA